MLRDFLRYMVSHWVLVAMMVLNSFRETSWGAVLAALVSLVIHLAPGFGLVAVGSYVGRGAPQPSWQFNLAVFLILVGTVASVAGLFLFSVVLAKLDYAVEIDWERERR